MQALSKLCALVIILCLLIQPAVASEIPPTSLESTASEEVADQSEAAPADPVSGTPEDGTPDTDPQPAPEPAPEPGPLEPQPEPAAPSEPAPIPAPVDNQTPAEPVEPAPIPVPVEETATSTATTTEPVATTTAPLPTGEFVPGEVIVKFKESSIDLGRASGEAKAEAFADAQNLELGESIEPANIAIMETTANPVAEAKRLESDPNVEFAEPNYIFRATEVAGGPTDAYWEHQWALKNTGQVILGDDEDYDDDDDDEDETTYGLNDSDIDVQEAWALTEGDGVIVAVIDTGVALDHPDLENNLWDGTNCVDDLGDAIVGGCQHGYDFGANDNDPTPFDSHGTHVAGIIAAEANGVDGIGIAGVAPEATIMAIRADTDDFAGAFYTSDLVRSIDFARENGADVINASWGGWFSSTAMYDAIERFGDEGGIFVAAAGNDGFSNDWAPTYPANYNLPNIISVAATDHNDELAWFSNYGPTSVHVAAPGVNILSTVIEEDEGNCIAGRYDCYSGTSMAAPHVAGVAALLKAYDSTLTVKEIKDAIIKTGDLPPFIDGYVTHSRRLNAFDALASVATVPVTGTIQVIVTLINDDGTETELSDLAFTVDHGYDRLFAGATTTLALAPGVYDINPVVTDIFTVDLSNCEDLDLSVGETLVCQITLDDIPDTTPPEIYLNGADPQRIKKGRDYVELGAEAYDDRDWYIEVEIDSSTVDTSEVGTYVVVYTATDEAGNVATLTRQVVVYRSGGGGGGGGGSKKPKPSKPAPVVQKPTPAPTPMPIVLPGSNPANASTSVQYLFATNFGMGSTGQDVLALQQILIDLGYLKVARTGYFGWLTKDALYRYQLDRGIAPAYGYMGPITRASLSTPPPVLPQQ